MSLLALHFFLNNRNNRIYRVRVQISLIQLLFFGLFSLALFLARNLSSIVILHVLFPQRRHTQPILRLWLNLNHVRMESGLHDQLLGGIQIFHALETENHLNQNPAFFVHRFLQKLIVFHVLDTEIILELFLNLIHASSRRHFLALVLRITCRRRCRQINIGRISSFLASGASCWFGRRNLRRRVQCVRGRVWIPYAIIVVQNAVIGVIVRITVRHIRIVSIRCIRTRCSILIIWRWRGPCRWCCCDWWWRTIWTSAAAASSATIWIKRTVPRWRYRHHGSTTHSSLVFGIWCDNGSSAGWHWFCAWGAILFCVFLVVHFWRCLFG
mmetsp:Transcript_15755/g.24166  ORF Transcript_15755/g.24166 Transcript_15755/m.24166 type:complete len:326 (+) Transcript_15755:319-1296(+)